MAESYRLHFKKVKYQDFFIKNNYDYSVVCNSKKNSQDTNILSRIRNTMVTFLNKKDKLPKYLLIVLDDDLIQALDYQGFGVSTMYGEWLEWLVAEISKVVAKRKEQLPWKAVKDDYPMIYLCTAPIHRNQPEKERDSRMKWNLVLTSLLKLYENMRPIKLKELKQDDDKLVDQNGHWTFEGLEYYWKAVDSSLRFNVTKRDMFLKNIGFKKANKEQVSFGRKRIHNIQHDELDKKNERDIRQKQFFRKRRKTETSNTSTQQDLQELDIEYLQGSRPVRRSLNF